MFAEVGDRLALRVQQGCGKVLPTASQQGPFFRVNGCAGQYGLTVGIDVHPVVNDIACLSPYHA